MKNHPSNSNLCQSGEKSHRITIRDVARAAGVSAGTVSHVLNGTAPISEETKKRVRQVIRNLGYRRNENARALRTSDSKIIGIVLQDISSEYYARCTACILQKAQELGYAVLTTDAHFSPSFLETGVSALVNRQVNGLIFIGGSNDESCHQMAEDAGIPIVFGDRFVENYPCVQFSNRQTMYRLMQALYQQGYREFCYIGESLDAQENLEQRFGGISDAVRDLRIPDDHFDVVLEPRLKGDKMQGAYNFILSYPELLMSNGERRIILTSNDLIAQSMISACYRLNLKIPEDIAIIGFDDSSLAAYSVPSITTIAQDPRLLGSKCFDLLMKRIENPKAVIENLMLDQGIAVRESAFIDAKFIEEAGLVLCEYAP